MQTIITGAIVIAGTIFIVLFLFFMNRRNIRKRNKTFFRAFTEAGTSRGISFSSQEMLHDRIIGLDRQHQRLLVFDYIRTELVTIIKLPDVKDCILTREYQHINFGNDKKAEMEKSMRFILLTFSFKNKPEQFTLSFYDSIRHSVYEMQELEQKARKWETLLSKLITKDTRAIA